MNLPAATASHPPLLRADDFLEWLEPGRHADLIDGEIFLHSPVNLRHARLVNFMDVLLRTYVRRKKLGELHRETMAMRLSSRNVFLPDLSFFTNEQATRLKETHAPFAPAFVLEVLSARTADRDLGPKFAAYEEHGVEEYWVLDPDKLEHKFFRREGEFLAEVAAAAARIESVVIPRFWVKREWLNPNSLPDEDACLREILGPSAADTR